MFVHNLGNTWNGVFEFFPCHDTSLQMEFALELPEVPCCDKLVLAWWSGTLYILSPSSLADGWFQNLGLKSLVDICGPVDLNHVKKALLVHDILLETPKLWNNTVLSLVVARRACQIDSFQMDDGSAFGVSFLGPEPAANLLLDFWAFLLPDALLDSLGFPFEVTGSDGFCKLTLLSSTNSPILPMHPICMHLFARGLLAVFALLQHDAMIPARLRYFHKVIWFGQLPKLYAFEYFMEIVHCVSFWVAPCLRLLILGRQFDWNQKLEDLAIDGLFKVDFVRPMHGGGPSGTSTKQSHKLQIQNALATSLLEEGYDLHWITTSIAIAVEKIGHRELSKCLTSSPANRLQIALKTFRNCQIDIPVNKPAQTSSAAFAKKKRALIPAQPNPANYRVTDGALLNQDDSHAVFTPSFSGQLTGYHFISPQDAVPWLQAGDFVEG